MTCFLFAVSELTNSVCQLQEIQAFNLPDYRPRMEQFQKAIKKVRACVASPLSALRSV